MSGLISYLPESEVAVARLCYQLPDFVTSCPTLLPVTRPDFVTSCPTLLPVAQLCYQLPDPTCYQLPDPTFYQLPDFVTSCPTLLPVARPDLLPVHMGYLVV